MEFLNESTIELVDCMGGDHSVVNSARVSFGVTPDRAAVDKLNKAERLLIKFLMKNRHGTPFESSVFTFRIETPIFVAREWFRHRIGSFNEMSARYKELPPRFFVANTARSQTGKPGSYKFEPMGPHFDTILRANLEGVYREAWESYQRMLEFGIAKEQARCVLPVGIMTQFYWTVNARSLMNFLSLRMDTHAMLEIREAATLIGGIFDLCMPHTAAAFWENDRVAP